MNIDTAVKAWKILNEKSLVGGLTWHEYSLLHERMFRVSMWACERYGMNQWFDRFSKII